jgi:hypothetical protein
MLRFLMRFWETWHINYWVLETEMERFLGSRSRPVREADNRTAILNRFSRKCGILSLSYASTVCYWDRVDLILTDEIPNHLTINILNDCMGVMNCQMLKCIVGVNVIVKELIPLPITTADRQFIETMCPITRRMCVYTRFTTLVVAIDGLIITFLSGPSAVLPCQRITRDVILHRNWRARSFELKRK